ncbi:unnamed protein product [Cuscuta epithymum]|uniref:Uncharacterized protein n=1 Tax=Cuscuta epithymum TaxID=186058 RepID=A0AAV0EGZ4_9ASTE|nr:unnamed protein product [Cuscuta epithymum]
MAMSWLGDRSEFLLGHQPWKFYLENNLSCSLVKRIAAGRVYLLTCRLKPCRPSFSKEVGKELKEEEVDRYKKEFASNTVLISEDRNKELQNSKELIPALKGWKKTEPNDIVTYDVLISNPNALSSGLSSWSHFRKGKATYYYSGGWNGKNAYHNGGYCYVMVGSDQCISRVSSLSCFIKKGLGVGLTESEMAKIRGMPGVCLIAPDGGGMADYRFQLATIDAAISRSEATESQRFELYPAISKRKNKQGRMGEDQYQHDQRHRTNIDDWKGEELLLLLLEAVRKKIQVLKFRILKFERYWEGRGTRKRKRKQKILAFSYYPP